MDSGTESTSCAGSTVMDDVSWCRRPIAGYIYICLHGYKKQNHLKHVYRFSLTYYDLRLELSGVDLRYLYGLKITRNCLCDGSQCRTPMVTIFACKTRRVLTHTRKCWFINWGMYLPRMDPNGLSSVWGAACAIWWIRWMQLSWNVLGVSFQRVVFPCTW